MYINIIKNSPKPAYQQITESIRKRILTRELQVDEELPSIRQLAQDTKVSMITVRRAYSDLEREGLIYSRPGMGYYVAELEKGDIDDVKLELIIPLLQEVVSMARELRLNPDQVQSLLGRMLTDQEEGGGRQNE